MAPPLLVAPQRKICGVAEKTVFAETEELSEEFHFVLNNTKITGNSHKIVCPWCTQERSRRNQSRQELTVTGYPDRVTYSCWHCKREGLIVTHSYKQQGGQRQQFSPERPPEKPKKLREASGLAPLEPHHLDFLRMRGISQATAAKAKVFAADNTYYPVAQARQPSLGFAYVNNAGMIDSAKFRSTIEKNFSAWQAAETFWGIEDVKVGDDIIIVEGELDRLAMMEAGIMAVSVPNGAPQEVGEEGKINQKEDRKFRYVWNAKDKIDAAKRVIIAVDADKPGEALGEELARRIGKAKCWIVKWTGGKDANDVLLAMGVEGVKAQVAESEPWPVAGLYDAEHFREQVWELYAKGLGKGASTGFDDVDELYTIAEGQVTIVTGIPSSGKSEFIDMLMVNLADKLDWSFCVCSFENEPRLHLAKLIAKKSGEPFFESRFSRRLNNQTLKETFAWVDEHFVFSYQDDGSQTDIDSILERIRVAVMRYGIRGAVIDPYNYIARPSDRGRETEWISDMLTKLKVFASAHGIHIWLVAHPAKLQRNAEGKYAPPTGYDISGSAHFFNKADCGVTVHREQDSPLDVQIHIWKCRFSWIGKQGMTKVVYDLN
jgi:twinkle protein